MGRKTRGNGVVAGQDVRGSSICLMPCSASRLQRSSTVPLLAISSCVAARAQLNRYRADKSSKSRSWSRSRWLPFRSQYFGTAIRLQWPLKHRHTRQQSRPRACLIQRLRHARRAAARTRGCQQGRHILRSRRRCSPSLHHAKPYVDVLISSRPTIDGQCTTELAIEGLKRLRGQSTFDSSRLVCAPHPRYANYLQLHPQSRISCRMHHEMAGDRRDPSRP
ncbi:hypothetical protein BDZ90DRAFT_87516 [Jaminaea rosea]|uniref:Uncharacterized protein n=1 Tax=Jaminaea rosea TaxID=1569628 RepID=A0A316UIW5_9BASI|nr:hypothetical protein BDZ90DRAFT_87516 [Jaminaea rosea]PWN24864.1 hypothetical protein BDZ90DRAFT_87516 [Jaminaea rosea]